MSGTRFRDLDKVLDRMSIVEDCCQVDTPKEFRKRNKFNDLEDQILKNRIDLHKQMSDFNHKVSTTKDYVAELEKKIECLSKKIDINVSRLWL